MKVFVIGNGPSATRNRIGSVIDSADVVVRINDFKTSGFEEFVGTKTDILFTCRLNEYVNTIHTFQEVILSLPMNPLNGVHIPDSVMNAPNISSVLTWQELEQITPMMGLQEGCYPSTGILCIMAMVHRFGHIYITGFDNFVNGNQHYYEQGVREVPTRHDGGREREIIETLIRAGKITDAWRVNEVAIKSTNVQ